MANMKLARMALVLATLCGGAAAFAHKGATGIVKERRDAMSELGDHSKLLGKMFKGEIAFDAAAVRDAANQFVAHAEQMKDWFPDSEDSRYGHMSQSKQAVWEQWDDFVEEVDDFLNASQAMQDTAHRSEDEAELRKSFFAAAKGCKSCHKVYRKPKKK